MGFFTNNYKNYLACQLGANPPADTSTPGKLGNACVFATSGAARYANFLFTSSASVTCYPLTLFGHDAQGSASASGFILLSSADGIGPETYNVPSSQILSAQGFSSTQNVDGKRKVVFRFNSTVTIAGFAYKCFVQTGTSNRSSKSSTNLGMYAYFHIFDEPITVTPTSAEGGYLIIELDVSKTGFAE